MKTKQSFNKLKSYCQAEDFKGWDPFDGLNSKLFQALPIIRNNRFCKLAWLQLFKRNPLNFRSFVGVEKGHNNKGLGLFLIGYCNLYEIDPKKEYLDYIHKFAEILIQNTSKGYAGACWGYNFDWQARAFFQPKYTPTVVATSFITTALLKAFEITKNEEYKEIAISAAQFVLKDLNRTYDDKGQFSFSYSPQDSSQVFNASLLGARLLGQVYTYTKDENLLIEAEKAIDYVCEKQQKDGSWAYGNAKFHQWKDNFHTGFNLECIAEYQACTKQNKYDDNLEIGLKYYVENYFEEDGLPKYYDTKSYPVDVHAPAQLVVTLFKMGKQVEYKPLIDKVLNWTIDNMQAENGTFYYQLNKNYTNKIPYMRWTQAWMFYALTFKLLIDDQSKQS